MGRPSANCPNIYTCVRVRWCNAIGMCRLTRIDCVSCGVFEMPVRISRSYPYANPPSRPSTVNYDKVLYSFADYDGS